MDGGGGEEHHKISEFSPLLVGLIGILFGVIVILIFHYIVMFFNRRNRPTTSTTNQVDNSPQFRTPSDVSTSSSTNSTSHLISVYRSDNVSEVKQQGSGEEMECAICLGEIMEGEEVRVMEECGHSFHMACIDLWLCSHPNCPVCRARVAVREPQSERNAVIVLVPVLS